MDAPNKVVDTESFSLYRVWEEDPENAGEEQKSVSKQTYQIQITEDEAMEAHVDDSQKIVFEDELNRVTIGDDGFEHLFRIPFADGWAAWNQVSHTKTVKICCRPDSRSYFQTSTGIFNAASMERILYAYGKFLFHCSFVEYEGQGILFSAPSGGGKTTQGLLWEQYEDAKMINGDRAVLEETVEGRYLCHGLPIAGSSGVFINRTCPLTVIFVVNKAEENQAIGLDPMSAFIKIYSELTVNTWDSEFKLAAVDFAMKLAGHVPVYQLNCRKDEGAVVVAKEIADALKNR